MVSCVCFWCFLCLCLEHELRVSGCFVFVIIAMVPCRVLSSWFCFNRWWLFCDVVWYFLCVLLMLMASLSTDLLSFGQRRHCVVCSCFILLLQLFVCCHDNLSVCWLVCRCCWLHYNGCCLFVCLFMFCFLVGWFCFTYVLWLLLMLCNFGFQVNPVNDNVYISFASWLVSWNISSRSPLSLVFSFLRKKWSLKEKEGRNSQVPSTRLESSKAKHVEN